jgi:hypothetical protein
MYIITLNPIFPTGKVGFQDLPDHSTPRQGAAARDQSQDSARAARAAAWHYHLSSANRKHFFGWHALKAPAPPWSAP